jgi:hypothetical protein
MAYPGYVIRGELSEDQVEADVAGFLGWCTPEGEPRFQLRATDESLTGADKTFDVGALLYLQFKRSDGLPPWDRPKKIRANESKLQDIRRFRQEAALYDSPSLFFGLRKRATHALDFQHNVLMHCHQPPTSYGVYVAPLHLTAATYDAALGASPRYLAWPFERRIYEIHMRGWVSRFGAIPFLRGHVSISPHDHVSSEDHYYAYSPAGAEVSWHSPKTLTRGPSRLSDFMVRFFNETLLADDGMRSFDQLDSLIAAGALPHAQHVVFRGTTPLERLYHYGEWLRDTFEIRQFVLLASRKGLRELRELGHL